VKGPRGAGCQAGGTLVSTADRRRIGVLVVVGLLAAVVIPAATGRVISGAPHAVPVSGPAATGSLLLTGSLLAIGTDRIPGPDRW
jgi:hypothetical protein